MNLQDFQDVIGCVKLYELDKIMNSEKNRDNTVESNYPNKDN